VVDYPTLFSWFVEKKTKKFMVDVLRINMAFFKDGQKELKIFKWLEDNKNGLAKNVAVLGDLPGPKIRLGGIGEKPLKVSKDESLYLYFGGKKKDKRLKGASVLVYGKPFANMVKEIDKYKEIGEYIRAAIENNGEVIMSIGDGGVILKAKDEANGVVECIVERGGKIIEKEGLTIKGAHLDISSFQKSDKDALYFLLENGGEFLAFIGVSFVKSDRDILNVKYHIEDYFYKKLKRELRRKSLKKIREVLTFKPKNRSEVEKALRAEARLRAPSVIAKIELEEAWDNIDRILDAADGIMVARGDLGLHLEPEKVPAIQKVIVRKCNLRGKPVIVATEMLSSMEESPEPTRAEATDVFNAILDGSDAVMLSGETAKGKYPAHAVRKMVEIAEEAEEYLKRPDLDETLRRALDRQRFQEVSSGSESLLADNEERFNKWLDEATSKINSCSGKEREWYEWIRDFFGEKLSKSKKQRTTDSISQSACLLSQEKQYSAIIASTLTGRTARMISRFRPEVVMLGCVRDTINARKLALSFGTYPVNVGMVYKKMGGIFNTTDEIFEQAVRTAKTKGYVQKDDMVIFIAGTPFWTLGEANSIQIKEVK